jgi:hypothetical protein
MSFACLSSVRLNFTQAHIKGVFGSAFFKKSSAILNQITILECLGLRFGNRKF